MKIAIAQINPTVGDLLGNADKILVAAQQAAALGANLLLTPELSLCGYPPRDLLMRPSFIQQMTQTMRDLAALLPPELTALVGLAQSNRAAAIKGEKPIFNSMALLRSGQVQEIFHKRLLPTYDVFDEDRYFESGTEVNIFTMPGEKGPIHIGVTICEDLWNNESFWGKRAYPVDPTQELVAQGVQIVVNLSASPFVSNKQALREQMIAHAAKQNHCPIVYVNQVGGNDDLIFDGQSLAVSRSGELMSRAAAFETDLQIVEFDESAADLRAAEIKPLPAVADAQIWEALVLGVRELCAKKCGGFTKAESIGLSGGVDSALVSAIAATALGPHNVLVFLMPSPYSSEHSISDAAQLASNLGISTQTIPIGSLMQGLMTKTFGRSCLQVLKAASLRRKFTVSHFAVTC